MAAICPNYLIIANLKAGEVNKLHYDGEWFSSVSWYSDQEIVFSTRLNNEITFWNININNESQHRVKIYGEIINNVVYRNGRNGIPPMLLNHYYSPKGQYVICNHKLLNLKTGDINELPSRINHICWKPDDSQLLIYIWHEIENYSYEKRIYLINTEPFDITELTEEFRNIISKVSGDIFFDSSQWTPDGKYVIFYASTGSKHVGYVVQPNPFKIILKKDKIIRWSPIPGWVLLQGGNTFEWIDYSGQKTIELDGWPNDWIWSPDRIHAARIEDGKVLVFKPIVPK